MQPTAGALHLHNIILYIRGVTIHVFVTNRHGTGTSGWLQRWTVNIANAKACFAMQNLKLFDNRPITALAVSVAIVKKYRMLR